jgi:hypothetical protein
MTTTTKTLRLFTVRADATTGEWLDSAEEIGSVEQAAHFAKVDTDDVHFDTFENGDETCAVEVTFVRA